MLVQVHLHEGDVKTYTYKTDLKVEVGDKVVVSLRGHEKVVTVVELGSPYQGVVQSIVRLHEPENPHNPFSEL